MDSNNNNNKGSSSNSSPRPDRPRLTEQEKKNNHIASENKRRKAIRDGFDRLAELVDLPGQGRSENVVLEQTIKVIKEQITEYHAHLEEARRLGVDMSDLVIPGIPDPKPSGQAQGVQDAGRGSEAHAQFHGQVYQQFEDFQEK
jgi:heteromeric Ino2p/Ino4p transcription factor